MQKPNGFTGALFLVAYLLSPFNVAGDGGGPFTPKASLIRYWKKQIRNELPPPLFFLSKASPMTAVESASFSKLAASQNGLPEKLPSFCSPARLLCFADLSDSSPTPGKRGKNSVFQTYTSNENFTNYGRSRLGALNSFANYSLDLNLPVDTFTGYSRDATGGDDNFLTYGPNGNVVDQSFGSYGVGSTGGRGDFDSYNQEVNVPNLRFGSYSTGSNGRDQSFKVYTNQTNSGAEGFKSYGRNANGADNQFVSYAKDSNVIGSGFSSYGKGGNSANDSFASYGDDGNVPVNTFKAYEESGNAATLSFSSYRDQSNVGDDSFQSYAKKSNSAEVKFQNYGKSVNEGSDKFNLYGDGARGQSIGFSAYGVNSTFGSYAKTGVSFAKYTNRTATSAGTAAATSSAANNNNNNRWLVEPGKFFRESMLKTGTIMPMPDIADKMPRRSFLPRTVSSKLPFSTSKLGELKRIFRAADNSSMEGMIAAALSECERPPSRGEKKRCVGSAEDMVDFVVSVLGRNVVVRTTQNVEGSKQKVAVGEVSKINGGLVTESVSCHQSLYPYLLYYCHSVPRVRVYEADLLDPKSKAKINRGVAICHLDTSSWSAGHGAFLALGSSPGRIEVCHWIFENDVTWSPAD